MSRGLILRDCENLLATLARVAGGALLRGPDGREMWSGGSLGERPCNVPVPSSAGTFVLVLPAEGRRFEDLARTALGHLAASREALDDLTATTRRLWAEQNLLFTASEVLRHGCEETRVLAWLAERVRVVRHCASVVLGWDGIAVEVRAGDLPPRLSVGTRLSPSAQLVEVLDGGEPLVFADARAVLEVESAGHVDPRPYLLAPLRCADRVQGALLLERTAGERAFTAEEVKLVQLLADIASVALTNRELVREAEHNARIQRELELAAEIQRRLLPPPRARYGRLDVSAACAPVSWVAGDGYLHHRLPGGTVVAAVFDITGHGIAASLSLAGLTARFHTLMSVVNSPADLLAILNDQMTRFDPSTLTLATAIVAFIDEDSGDYQVSAAGHPPALAVRSGGEVEALHRGGLPLGVLAGCEYLADQGRLAAGDALLLYSDGISEAPGADGGFSSWEHLVGVVREAGRGAEALTAAVMESTRQFTGAAPAADDQTVLAVARVEA